MSLQARICVGIAIGCLVAGAGCAPKMAQEGKKAEAPARVSCIAVLPTVPVIETEQEPTAEEWQDLEKGIVVMDSLLQEALAARPRVRFTTDTAMADGARGPEALQELATQTGCNAVLEVTLGRYTERVGNEFGVDRPAAVTFSYRLYDTQEGRMLCHGRFEERQQALMDNLFTLNKVRTRGLVWLTAEELARSGIREKFGECSYLGGPVGK